MCVSRFACRRNGACLIWLLFGTALVWYSEGAVPPTVTVTCQKCCSLGGTAPSPYQTMGFALPLNRPSPYHTP